MKRFSKGMPWILPYFRLSLYGGSTQGMPGAPVKLCLSAHWHLIAISFAAFGGAHSQPASVQEQFAHAYGHDFHISKVVCAGKVGSWSCVFNQSTTKALNP